VVTVSFGGLIESKEICRLVVVSYESAFECKAYLRFLQTGQTSWEDLCDLFVESSSQAAAGLTGHRETVDFGV